MIKVNCMILVKIILVGSYFLWIIQFCLILNLMPLSLTRSCYKTLSLAIKSDNINDEIHVTSSLESEKGIYVFELELFWLDTADNTILSF